MSLDPKQLTDRQAIVLGVIRDSIRRYGFPPTLREIGDRAEIKSPNGVMGHLDALEKKGWIVRNDAIARGIRLTGPSEVDLLKARVAELEAENISLGGKPWA